MSKKSSPLMSVRRHRRMVFPDIYVGINETCSDYLPFWKDKRIWCGYFKLDEM